MIIILRSSPNHQNPLSWKIILNTLRRAVLKLKTTRLVFDLDTYIKTQISKCGSQLKKKFVSP